MTSKSYKVTIFFPFTDELKGGGNHFLKALKNEFIKMDVWTDNFNEAKCVLFNSHQFVNELFLLKKKYPKLYFIHRVDGPMSIYNKPNDHRDQIVRLMNRTLADGTVFQSNWSRGENFKILNIKAENSCVIYNSPSSDYFFPKKETDKAQKIRIVSSGWSTNKNKGLDSLKWIDQNLDFSKYTFTHVGGIDFKLKNITVLAPVSSKRLGEILRENDIYFFPSKFEACSNALLEGIHCGLVPIAYNGSSNIEIVANQDLLFLNIDELPSILEKVSKKLQEIQANIKIESLEDVASRYYKFMTSREGRTKKIFFSSFHKLKIPFFKVIEKIANF